MTLSVDGLYHVNGTCFARWAWKFDDLACKWQKLRCKLVQDFVTLLGERYQDYPPQQQLSDECWTWSEQESQSPLSTSSLFSYFTFSVLKNIVPDSWLHLHVASQSHPIFTYISLASQEAQEISVFLLGSCSKWLWLGQQRVEQGNICNLIALLLLLMHTKHTHKKSPAEHMQQTGYF